MPVSFSGLSSGLDTQAIIAQLMTLERIPIQRVEQRKTDIGQQLTTLADIVTKMKTLQEKVLAMDAIGEARTMLAKSGDEAVFEATASGDAEPGSFGIQVDRLASAERTWSKAFASKTALGLVGTGDLVITVGSDAPKTISIDQATDSLESVAAKINASGARASASILYDGTSYFLVVAGKDSGTANGITFDDPTALDLDVAGAEKQAALDSKIVMDGQIIYRPTNVLTDVLKGVSVRLKKVQAGAVGLTVDVDPAGMRARAQAFVDAYNEVARAIGAQFAWSGKSKGQGSLAGDATLRDQLNRLQNIVTSEVTGLSGRYTALSEIGISTSKDGTLKLDATEFDKAAREDALGVAKLFTRETGSKGVAAQIDDEVKSATDFASGRFTLRRQGLDARVTQADKDVARLEAQLVKTEERLRAQFTALEQLMAALNTQGGFLQGIGR